MLVLCVFAGKLYAADKPLWEAGVGLVALDMPHYLGANQSSSYVLPLPYFIYRGEYIRADRGGLRGFIYDSEKLDLRLSMSGALPVNSEDNDARQGMDDLDLMLEVGPTLRYKIYKKNGHIFRADWPLRAAFTVGSNFFHHQGWTSNPRLHYEKRVKAWTVSSNLGLVFSDSHYHGYIYNVGAADVTANRAFYQANSGYTGARFSLGAKRRMGDFFWGASLHYYDLNGAVNVDSPLLKSEDYFSVSLMLAWAFSKSNEKAERQCFGC